MKQVFYLLILSVVLCACDNESTQIGANFFRDAALDVSIVDTVSVKLATIKYERLATNHATRLLVGHHDDETLGSVTASTYFEISSPGITTLTTSNSSYNYLVLVLRYDDYSFYDTTLTNTLDVYRVSEKMEEDDKGLLYNYSHFGLHSGKLGSFTYQARPHGDSIAIKLDDQLGRDLYDKLVGQADETNNQSDFLNYFRGLAIMPDSTLSGSMIGFTTKAELRLYYVDKSVVPNNRDAYISFSLNDGGTYFNHIWSDTQGTAIDGKLSDEKDRVNASQTSQMSFMQAGTGLAVRVDFPYVKDLTGLPDFYVTNAILKIYPVHGTYNDLIPLPNTLTSLEIYSDNSTYSSFASGIRLITETELPRDSYYSVDVTRFIQGLINEMGDRDDQHGLLLRLDDSEYTASVSRLFAGTARTTLTIYYATIKNN